MLPQAPAKPTSPVAGPAASPPAGPSTEPNLPPLTSGEPPRNEADPVVTVPIRQEAKGSADPSGTRAGARELPPAKLPTEVAGPSIADGDRLFASGRYEDAGRCYAALVAQNRLPAHRQAHWAYCRMVDVARRINARPKTPGEWDEIEAEIVKIQRITPNNWYGEYLHNKVAEVRRGGVRIQNKSDSVVARGRPTDDTQNKLDPEPRRLSRLFGKSRAATPAPAQAADVSVANNPELPLNLPQSSPNPGLAVRTGGGRADLDSTGTEGADRSSPRSDPAVQLAVAQDVPDNTTPWQVLETPNFRIFHQNARLAEAAGQAAEAVRAAQAKRWESPALQRPWTPPCELYLYPTGKVFARETKQPESSPGFSTMMCNGNRVVAPAHQFAGRPSSGLDRDPAA